MINNKQTMGAGIDELGPCCGCERSGPEVRNVVMFDEKSPTPGRGWGCAVCGLPPDGAIGVLCDDCLGRHQAGEQVIRFACRGYPAIDGRVPIETLSGRHAHDLAQHPELEHVQNAYKTALRKRKGVSNGAPESRT